MFAIILTISVVIVQFLFFLGPDFCLNILHGPPVFLQLGAHHPILSLGLSLLGRLQTGVIPYEVFVLVLIISLWCNLRRKTRYGYEENN